MLTTTQCTASEMPSPHSKPRLALACMSCAMARVSVMAAVKLKKKRTFRALWERFYRDGRQARHLIAVEPLPQQVLRRAKAISRVYAGVALLTARGASLLAPEQGATS